MGQLYSRRREMSFRDMILFCSLERVLSVPVNCCRLRRKAIGWGLAPAVLNLCWLSVGNNNIILNCSADKYKSSLCQCRVQNLQSRDHEVFRLTVAETVIECHRVIERLLLLLSRILIGWRPEEGIKGSRWLKSNCDWSVTRYSNVHGKLRLHIPRYWKWGLSCPPFTGIDDLHHLAVTWVCQNGLALGEWENIICKCTYSWNNNINGEPVSGSRLDVHLGRGWLAWHGTG